jgi:alpha-beta hydrolase superfamily lysophospholipase
LSIVSSVVCHHQPRPPLRPRPPEPSRRAICSSTAPPAAGWPGVVLLHGLGGSKEQCAPVADILAAHGYAALAYSARGSGTSTGDLELAGPDETSDERALHDFLAARPEVSDTKIGCWGISYGGGECWNAAAAGVAFGASGGGALYTTRTPCRVAAATSATPSPFRSSNSPIRAGDAVELRRNDGPYRRFRLPESGAWSGAVPALPRRPLGTRLCTFDVLAPPTTQVPVLSFARARP